MPAVVEGAKSSRAKLFRTLNRSGAHFIGVGSGSSSSNDGSSSSSSSSSSEDEERGPLSVTTGEETKTAQGGEAIAKAERGKSHHHHHQKKKKKKKKKKKAPSARGVQQNGEADGSSTTMSVRYSRVTSGDGSSSPITEAEQSKRRRSQLADRISNKLHALFWVVVGATVVYRTDFVRVLMEDERVNRFWFNIGVVCFSINAVILAYLTVWLPHVRGVRVSWNVYSPRAIPTATVVGLLCALALNISLWNVWGFLTPLILFAVFIGCLFSLHFVPWPC